MVHNYDNKLPSDGNRGKLTIFLGAAPGVGKTFSMLESAREKHLEGVKVVIAVLEGQGRTETNKLAEGLVQIPLTPIDYHGRLFAELDLDRLLSIKPELVLVDELAHSNIPGSRHDKRYQDVEELLTKGINVYTTLNVGHVETLNDIVFQITGVRVKETVPDRILEESDQILVVDLPPEELLQRLQDGKVVVDGNINTALHNFFKPGTINALRELTLIYTARRVERQMQVYMRSQGIPGPWPAGERIMVCVSPSPFSAQLVRTAKRMAEGLQAEWIAVYVETPCAFSIEDNAKTTLAQNIHLAEELGAEIIRLTGDDLAKEIVELARQRNVSQIIMGKSLQRSIWQRLSGSLVDKVIRLSHGISVQVIPGVTKEKSAHDPKQKHHFEEKFPFVAAVLMMVGLTLFLSPFRDYLGLVNIAMIYLLPVLFCADRWGTKPAITVAVVGVISYDFFFVPPRLSFTVVDLRYLISFGIFILVAFLTGTLSTRLKSQVEHSREREKQVSALYDLSRDIAAVADLDSILNIIVRKVALAIDGQVAVFIPSESGRLELTANSHEASIFTEANERAVATWVFDHGKRAGMHTETLSAARALYLPLTTEQGIQGVLSVCTSKREESFQSDQLRLLNAFSVLAAVAINRAKLAEKARESLTYIESEKLRTALFNSISHDLRTPLASITGAVTGLLEGENLFSAEDRVDLLQNIRQGAVRLSRFVNNLLEMAKLESGMLKLNKDWCDIQDLVGVSIKHMAESLGSHKIATDIPSDLPMVEGDFLLLEQVITNLLDNSIKYSEDGSQIKILARGISDFIEVTVSDIGQQIPHEDLQNIFTKFYRLKTPMQVSGSGLGLSICKEIVEVHGGLIWAENNYHNGVDIKFTLPYSELHEEKPFEGGSINDGE